MNLNQGKRNKQAVQVLNKVEYDSEGNPIGMMEDPSNPASANFGTPRDPRRGGCYLGNGSAYITITGLLSTDTVEVFDGSNMPTISNDRLDIASGDRVFGVKIFRLGELWAKYNCSENSGSIAYDSSGNGNHGTIINAITTTPEENPNSIHQYQDVYSFENEEGYSELNKVFGSFNLNLTESKVVSIYGKLASKTINQTYFIDTDRDGGGLDLILLRTSGLISIVATYGEIYVDGIVSTTFPVDNRLHEIKITGVELDAVNHVISLGGRHSTGSNPVYNIQDFYIQDEATGDILTSINDFTPTLTGNAPKNSSITLPPFKDVLGNNLQYVGSVPGKAKFVNSSCFLSDGNAYLSGDVLTTDTIAAHPESEVPVCTTDGRLDFPIVGGKYFDITIERGGSVIARLPLCEPIIDPSNHTYHDVSGNGNHATLVNGTLANEGKQDKFHYLQRGVSYLDTVTRSSDYSIKPTRFGASLVTLGLILEFGHIVDNKLCYKLINNGATAAYKTQFNNRGSEYGKEFYEEAFVYVPTGSSITTITLQFSNSSVLDLQRNDWNASISPYNTWVKIWAKYTKIGYSNFHININGISGSLDEYIYFREYRICYSENQVPVKLDNNNVSGFENVDISQDSHSFLNTGTELEAYDYPALKQADKDNNFWYIGDAGVRRVSHHELAIENLMSDKIFLDTTDKNI